MDSNNNIGNTNLDSKIEILDKLKRYEHPASSYSSKTNILETELYQIGGKIFTDNKTSDNYQPEYRIQLNLVSIRQPLRKK